MPPVITTTWSLMETVTTRSQYGREFLFSVAELPSHGCSSRGHLEYALRMAAVECKVEPAAAGSRVGHEVALNELVKRARHLLLQNRAIRAQKFAGNHIGTE